MTQDKEIKKIIKSCKEDILRLKQMCDEGTEDISKSMQLRKEIELALHAEGFYDYKRV